MSMTAILALARHLYAERGAKAIAETAEKAASCRQAGDEKQAKEWRRVEAALREMRGPRQG